MAIEQAVQRRLTTAFIATDPVMITLTPIVKTKSATGGVNRAPAPPREPQTFRLVEPSDSGFRDTTRTQDATQLTIEFLLLGNWDAAMADGDVFIHDGFDYKIDHVLPFNGYETRARVVRHGW